MGSDLSLTCSISLNSEVPTDGRLEVMWTLPNTSMIMAATSGTSATLTGSGTSYNSTLTVIEVSTSDAGNYTCSASITSSNLFVTSSIPTMGAALVVIQGNFKTCCCLIIGIFSLFNSQILIRHLKTSG